MKRMQRLSELRDTGAMRWSGEQRAWVAEPDDVVRALAHDGFQEYKHEVTRSGHDRTPSGGVWQGLDNETGSVASAIWVRADMSLVFIDIDGETVRGDA